MMILSPHINGISNGDDRNMPCEPFQYKDAVLQV